MKPTYTLHKLPKGLFIVTSDKPNDLGGLHFDKEFKFISNPSRHNVTDTMVEVIAQQDQIDFSALKEEEQKEIGWFDFLKMGRDYSNKKWENYCDRENPTPEQQEQDLFRKILGIEGSTYDWCRGFQKAQELLSDRRFTLEDMIESYRKGEQSRYSRVGEAVLEKEFIQSLSQKSWKVEIELEEYGTVMKDFKDVNYRPKLTNGKIKILKLC